MSIIGVIVVKGYVDFIVSTSNNKNVGTNELYLYEMLDLLKKEKTTEVSFSYNHVGSETGCELISPKWVPDSLSNYVCGKILKEADDILKSYLKVITPMVMINKLVEAFLNPNLKTGDNLFVETKKQISRLRILTNEVTVNNNYGDHSFCIDNVSLKLDFNQTSLEGAVLPVNILQNMILNHYENKIEDIIKNDIEGTHPYSKLKKVIIAQHIANYLIKNKIDVLDQFDDINKNYEHVLKNKFKFVPCLSKIIKYYYDKYELKIWEAREPNVGCAILAKNEIHKNEYKYFLVKATYLPNSLKNLNIQMSIYDTVDENSIKGMNFFSQTTTSDACATGGIILNVNDKKYIRGSSNALENSLYSGVIYLQDKFDIFKTWVGSAVDKVKSVDNHSTKGFRGEIIVSAQYVKRPIEMLDLADHHGVLVRTAAGNSYLIHSTPKDGTVVTDANLMSNKWKIDHEIPVNGSKTVGEVFNRASGHTNSGIVNYLTSLTCIKTAKNAEEKLKE